jgi:hypothetical protein
MPFKSKAQMRKFRSMEEQGKLPKGTARQWTKETEGIENLPERVLDKKAFVSGIIDYFTKKEPQHFSPPGASYTSSYADIQKVFGRVVTTDKLFKEIENDPKLSRAGKEKAKREILHFEKKEQSEQKHKAPSGTLMSKGMGYGGSALLAYLASKNVDSVPLKLLLGGAIVLAGGPIMSSLVDFFGQSQVINPGAKESIPSWSM